MIVLVMNVMMIIAVVFVGLWLHRVPTASQFEFAALVRILS